MDAKSKIEAIKQLLGLKFEAAAPAGENAEPAESETPKNEITLKDGIIARYEGDLAVGGELYVVTPQGETIAPDGNYEMEDGTVITVAGGTISAVMPPAESAAPDQGMSKDFTEDIEALKAEMSKNAELLAKVEAITAELNNVKEAFMKTVELVETFNNTPANPEEKPIDAMFKKQDPTEKIKAMAEALKSFKK